MSKRKSHASHKGASYDITASMVTERANVYSSSSANAHNAIFRFDQAGIQMLAADLIAAALGAPWPLQAPPAWHTPNKGKLIQDRAAKPKPGAPPVDAPADTSRLNLLEAAGGCVAGMADGKAAFRILGFDSWHPTLRQAIDDLST